MGFKTEHEARAAGEAARKQLGDGWTLDVRASAGGGFHFEVYCPPVSVFSSELSGGSFWAMVAPEPDAHGHGGAWPGDTVYAASPAGAIAGALKRYREHRDNLRAQFDRLDAAIGNLPLKIPVAGS